jgi:hypothetical protein
VKNSNRLRRLLFGLGIIACSLPSLAGAGSRAIKATVCAICADPKTFTGRVVSISGEYESDGIEREVVTDPECHDMGIAIMTPRHFKGEAEFFESVQQGSPLDKKVTGTFIGRFIWHPQVVPKRILELTEVRNFSVTMR